MDITLLKTFLEVAATGSFVSASERLYVTQAADSAVNVITVDDAIDALNQIGINVPRSTGADGLNSVLQNLRSDGVTPMSPEQVQQFLDLTGSNR